MPRNKVKGDAMARFSVTGLRDAICDFRERTRWSQQDFAKAVNVTQTTVARWERGDKKVLRINSGLYERIKQVFARFDVPFNCRVIW